MADNSTSANVAGYVQAAAAVTGVIAGIIDAKKRREFQEKFAKYSADQQMALAQKVADAKTQTDKLAAISQAMVQYDLETTRQQTKREIITYAVAGGFALVLLVMVIVSIHKK